MLYLGMKGGSNFNFSLLLVSKISLTFHYKRMPKKCIYGNLQEKYKNSVFKILKLWKIRTLDRLAILTLIRRLLR